MKNSTLWTSVAMGCSMVVGTAVAGNLIKDDNYSDNEKKIKEVKLFRAQDNKITQWDYASSVIERFKTIPQGKKEELFEFINMMCSMFAFDYKAYNKFLIDLLLNIKEEIRYGLTKVIGEGITKKGGSTNNASEIAQPMISCLGDWLDILIAYLNEWLSNHP